MSAVIEQLYYERELARLLGLSREDLSYIRFELLKKDGGWRRQGRDVVITQPGLDKILEYLKGTSNAVPDVDFTEALVAPPEKKTAQPGQIGPMSRMRPMARRQPLLRSREMAGKPGLVELKVKRCYPNPRMLQATDPSGTVVDVRVKTNKNFVPKMVLHGRLVCPGKYEMEGRCPRTRGRY